MSATGFPPSHDVAVAGGGPAGCAAAIELARRGRRVILLERERFPRFHIGESLLATANESFEALGIAGRVRDAGFPEKWGATLSTHDGAAGRTVDFASSGEIARPQTWQVRRDRFDALLLDRAREVGVEVREGCRVADVELGADGVELRLEQGEPVRAAAIVDASGRSGLIARKLGLRRDEPLLANVSIYSHFSGVPRAEGERSGDIRIIARDDAGWFWFIPVDDDLTSVGLVLPRSLYLELPKGSPEQMLLRELERTPVCADLMRNAERLWPVRVEKDFSYGAERYAGDRWLLVGDAGSFLDPVFSTGVSIALESGLEAAAAIDGALAAGDLDARRFRGFDRVQRRRFAVYRRFVLAFYTPWFRDLFFQPGPPPPLFRAVVTVLAGNWRPSAWTRLLVSIFFGFVALQKRFGFSEPLARRDAAAGFPVGAPEAEAAP